MDETVDLLHRKFFKYSDFTGFVKKLANKHTIPDILIVLVCFKKTMFFISSLNT